MTNKMHNIIWPGWETVRMIGRGSFGAVYEIERDVLGEKEKAALKVISIPQNVSDIDEMYADGYDDESISCSFQSHLKNIISEYTLMRKMSDCVNVVSCEDIRYTQHADGIGWDIFIKMELLTPLTKALPDSISEETVVRIARDICNALDACGKYEIVHRDIKPQNIFVSSNGDYKLGDFGVAKVIEKTMGGTKIGTYKYMAPEVCSNRPYGVSADIYSLGLVLYWMLNERRLPFLPMPPEKLTAGLDTAATERRLSGETLPPPKHGSKALQAVVLKACAFDQKERYASAREMLDALESLQAVPEEIQESDDPPEGVACESCGYLNDTQSVFCSHCGKPLRKVRKRFHVRAAVIAAVAVVAVILAVVASMYGGQKKTPAGNTAPSVKQTESISANTEPTSPFEESILQTYYATSVGRNEFGQCGVQSWDDIVAISAGSEHTVGLKADGTVVAVGNNEHGRCDVDDWLNVVAVSAGVDHTVGLRADGTVVAVGNNEGGPCDVENWSEIIAISAGFYGTVGLKRDGTVVANGLNASDDLDDWKNIIAISAGRDHTVGLKADGTVVATGSNEFGQCAVSGWTDIVAVSAGRNNTVGLKADGTVVAVGNNEYGQCNVSGWTDIVDISIQHRNTVGLKSDGTVVAVGSNDYGQCNVSDWTNVAAVEAGNYHTVVLIAKGEQ